MTRTLLTAIFLTLSSQTAWGEIAINQNLSSVFDCETTLDTELPSIRPKAETPRFFKVYISPNFVDFMSAQLNFFFDVRNNDDRFETTIRFLENEIVVNKHSFADQYKFYLSRNGEFHFLIDSGLDYIRVLGGKCK